MGINFQFMIIFMQNCIKYWIFSTFFFIFIEVFGALAQENKNIAIDFNLGAQGEFEIKKVYFTDLALTIFSDFPTPYSLQVISTENKILFEKYLPKNFITNQLNQNQIIIPLFYTASSINFFYNRQKLTSIDLIANFCKSGDRVCYKYCAFKKVDEDCFFCGNGVCEKNESRAKCPQDCSGLKSRQSENLILPENIAIEFDDLNKNIASNIEKRYPGVIFYISFGIGVVVIYFLFRKKH